MQSNFTINLVNFYFLKQEQRLLLQRFFFLVVSFLIQSPESIIGQISNDNLDNPGNPIRKPVVEF